MQDALARVVEDPAGIVMLVVFGLQIVGEGRVIRERRRQRVDSLFQLFELGLGELARRALDERGVTVFDEIIEDELGIGDA